MARKKHYPELRKWLKNHNQAAILDFSDRQPRALSFLTALTYDQDSLIAWRAVEAVGLAAERISEQDQDQVRNHLRRLLWSLNDESGGIGWRAAETIGEILYQCRPAYREFIPFLLSLLDMEAEEDAVRFRPGVLWAIGRIAQVYPEVGQEALPRIMDCVWEENAQTRGMALWCLTGIKPSRVVPGISSLWQDKRFFQLYEGGELRKVRISEIARQLAHG